MTKHFIDFDNFPFEVLQDIIDRAIVLKKDHNKGVINNSLKNKTLAMILINHRLELGFLLRQE